MNLLLFIFAWLLIPTLTVWNLIVVNKKYGNKKGYFRSTNALDNTKGILIKTNFKNDRIRNI